MFQILEKGFRGGICIISRRHARANNRLLGADRFDSSQPSNFIIYLDVNNLYGWAMSQPMPTGGFRWMLPKEYEKIEWAELKDEQTTGYFLEVDLDYPAVQHNAHNY